MATSPSDRWGPPPDVLAAIVAAVDVAWPAAATPAAPAPVPVRRPPGWRFSGRWWAPDDVVGRRP